MTGVLITKERSGYQHQQREDDVKTMGETTTYRKQKRGQERILL